MAGATGVSALVLLASGLPGHAKLRSDLRPADALADGSLDEDRQFFLGFVSLDPRLPDSLKQLGLGQLADSPRRIWLGRGRPIAPIRLNLPGPTRCLLLRLAHPTSMRSGADNPVLTEPCWQTSPM
jgi:hypothetical protein